jgi:proteasome accessory factor B
MKTEGIFKKYLLLYRLLGKPYTFPDAPKITSCLQEQGISVSKRTLERDFAALRAEFGLSVKYNRGRKGYFLPQEGEIQ